MIKCPNCEKEIRYISGAPSTGNPGQPIAVDVVPVNLISKYGRWIEGYREHVCSTGEDYPAFIKTIRAIFDKPDGDLDDLAYRLRLARNMEVLHGG
ncbi:MAG: hypothetical protein LBH43_12810 [Treponema sp.]|nr:hypothetical protein [Treponema sp.]